MLMQKGFLKSVGFFYNVGMYGQVFCTKLGAKKKNGDKIIT